MHDIMRFPSEKNKQKGNRDMGGDPELAVKHNTVQLGMGKDVGNRRPPGCCPGHPQKILGMVQCQWPHCISDAGLV